MHRGVERSKKQDARGKEKFGGSLISVQELEANSQTGSHDGQTRAAKPGQTSDRFASQSHDLSFRGRFGSFASFQFSQSSQRHSTVVQQATPSFLRKSSAAGPVSNRPASPPAAVQQASLVTNSEHLKASECQCLANLSMSFARQQQAGPDTPVAGARIRAKLAKLPVCSHMRVRRLPLFVPRCPPPPGCFVLARRLKSVRPSMVGRS